MSSQTKMVETGKSLNQGSMRITSQRTLILEIIRRGHLDADEIYRQAKKKQPHLSLSTVYRSLQLFKKLGLVEELHLDEAHHHYEVKPSSEHQHLVCLGCGNVVEFECPISPKLRKKLARENNFEITGVEIRMTGYCAKCRQKSK